VPINLTNNFVYNFASHANRVKFWFLRYDFDFGFVNHNLYRF